MDLSLASRLKQCLIYLKVLRTTIANLEQEIICFDDEDKKQLYNQLIARKAECKHELKELQACPQPAPVPVLRVLFVRCNNDGKLLSGMDSGFRVDSARVLADTCIDYGDMEISPYIQFATSYDPPSVPIDEMLFTEPKEYMRANTYKELIADKVQCVAVLYH